MTESLREIVGTTRAVLFGFDGPLCRLFAGHAADTVAGLLRARLSERGVTTEPAGNGAGAPVHGTAGDLLSSDPRAVLRAASLLNGTAGNTGSRSTGNTGSRSTGDAGSRSAAADPATVTVTATGLVADLEELLTAEEIRATATAMPTAWADPLIRTWSAVGVRLAVVTDHSSRAALAYLRTRGLAGCFGPHVYGRTPDPRPFTPHPGPLRRALAALDTPPAHALMIGDTPRDLEAAGEAGVPFLGYARNARKDKALRDAGAALVVGSLEDVLTAVREAGRPIAV